ncbi:hypothetical protein [Streptomyces griseoaurantiacus]|uniref:hypothetical protein n=1 Tax=Streptomyces griseoaurantiacus TaxID=68213 RepID=UPI0030E072A2
MPKPKMRATPKELRAAAEAELTPLGEQRRELLAKLAEVERELRPAVVAAVNVELPLRRVAELTGISPNTARRWAAADLQ